MIALRIAAALAALTPLPALAQPAWDPQPWLEDVAAMRTAFLTKYANREWIERERGIPLDRAFDAIEVQVRAAGSDAEARATLDRLLAGLNDGHVALRWPRPASPIAPASAPGEAAPPADAAAFCRAQGYDANRGRAGIAAALPAYRPVADERLLPTGLLDVNGTMLGVLRIPVFDPAAFPVLCTESVAALGLPVDQPCNENCQGALITEAYRRLNFALIARLDQLREAGAQALLVDLTGNGGGSEWAEAAARMLTPRRLESARVGFVRGEHWARQWANTAAALREATETAAPEDRARLADWIARADAARLEAETPCDPAAGCAWLGSAGYATGLIAAAPPQEFAGKDWGVHVFSIAQEAHPWREGVWRAPLIVLVDDKTFSAAEEFTALLRDNDAAIVLGSRTGGAGCGHTWGGTPTTLPNSGAVLELPDCARFRRDGSNEVAGIIPDVLIGWRASDSNALRTRLLEAALPAALVAARQP
ncbi:S41 family peptidase [Sphingosinithalassobacter sp. CS137]|uniref:S41 family peptidase n=1 Tax=Sphingosinithalassobacter sp. CS137 TaxID=2762748 RepID=UPI00165E5C65|nr:S41 family peptidase [Sphingosinithalassobacter sp. CS137]